MGTKNVRGARERILAAACELFHRNGIRGTSIDKILQRSRTGKSQFAHYFKNKDGLVLAVLDTIEHAVRNEIVASNYSIKSWDDFERWFGRYIQFQEDVSCELSCPFATIGSDLSREQNQLRRTIKVFFEWCASQLARFFAERKAAGELSADSNPDALADLCMAVMEGGMLVSKISRNSSGFKNAAGETLRYIRMLRGEVE